VLQNVCHQSLALLFGTQGTKAMVYGQERRCARTKEVMKREGNEPGQGHSTATLSFQTMITTSKKNDHEDEHCSLYRKKQHCHHHKMGSEDSSNKEK
jgi:hypothetical protein